MSCKLSFTNCEFKNVYGFVVGLVLVWPCSGNYSTLWISFSSYYATPTFDFSTRFIVI